MILYFTDRNISDIHTDYETLEENYLAVLWGAHMRIRRLEIEHNLSATELYTFCKAQNIGDLHTIISSLTYDFLVI